MNDINFCPNCGHALSPYHESFEEANIDEDELYEKVKQFVIETQKASTASLQRKFRIGYGRASRFMDMLAERGVVSQADGIKPRKVLSNS